MWDRKHIFSLQKSSVHKDIGKTEEDWKGRKMCLTQRGYDKAFWGLFWARGPKFSQHAPSLKRENASEFNLAIFPGLNPNWENIPASIHFHLNSQISSLLKKAFTCWQLFRINKTFLYFFSFLWSKEASFMPQGHFHNNMANLSGRLQGWGYIVEPGSCGWGLSRGFLLASPFCRSLHRS